MKFIINILLVFIVCCCCCVQYKQTNAVLFSPDSSQLSMDDGGPLADKKKLVNMLLTSVLNKMKQIEAKSKNRVLC